VLSNRAVDGGVEILALPSDAVGALQSATRERIARSAEMQAAQPATAARYR